MENIAHSATAALSVKDFRHDTEPVCTSGLISRRFSPPNQIRNRFAAGDLILICFAPLKGTRKSNQKSIKSPFGKSDFLR